MILYFHFRDYVFEYPLPACNDRRVSVNLSDEMDSDLCVLNFEVWDNVWHIMSSEEAELTIENHLLDDYVLKNGDVVNGRVKSNSVAFAITVHAINQAFTFYDKYSIKGKDIVEIGGDGEADIIITDTYISKNHASLRKSGSEVVLIDHSTNGSYIHGKRVDGQKVLDIMDVIYIAGVKIVYMGDFLAINQAGKRQVKLLSYSMDFKETDIDNGELIRSPRILESLETEEIEIESPPQPQNGRRQPLIFTVGPALTMPLPILASVFFTAQQGTNFMFGMIASVLASAVVATGWALANVLYEKKRVKKEEEHRQSSYRQYIDDNEKLLQSHHRKNAAIINGQFLSLKEILSILAYNKSVIWNRNVNQPDFLSVRLGTGYTHFQCDIKIPKRRFSLVSDLLQEEPHKLREQYKLIPNCASLLKLDESKIIGVVGNRQSVRTIAQIIALQTAALHCYTDVKMAFVLSPGEERFYEWANPLPHVRWQDNKIRLMCADENQRQNVLYYLSGVLRSRIDTEKEKHVEKPKTLPHIVVFVTNPYLISGENIYRYMVDNNDYGVTFVLLYELFDRLPNECTHVIQKDSDFSGYYSLDKSPDETKNIEFDTVDERLPARLSRRIGGYIVTELATGEIPGAISFLAMYNVSTMEEWDLYKRWKSNRAYESLRAMVGIGTGGKPLYLDIHEKQHGPHGLIAGTTGSGKSETIQTYILSLAMNFHPHEISLILIDYKGGGMANAFLDLPHLAGTITNLDGNQTIRALRSIRAEIKRRQTLFNQFGVNHIDNYSRYFREGTATEPMPHLIIISDEFAELKKEQPEFIRELVSTARVGRSLGVHLILATQKPAGVVDDEIWSNSRFKICLRVQDKQDSNEMLHRPDAAYLTNIGRAYMQIGNDEIFEMFQSGYSGAYYEPDDDSPEDSEITMVSLDGSPLVLKQKKYAGDYENRPTQLSAGVEFIRKTSDKLNVKNARQLWLPELEEGITLQDIYEKFTVGQTDGIAALYGVVDNPAAQTQIGSFINFSKIGNLLLAGMPGMGKSTMIQTILYSLVTRYSPEEVNLYCLDCSGALTRVFMDLPHCGGIVGPDDSERVARLFQLIESMLAERSQLFEKANVGSFEEYKLVSNTPLPTVLIVIDNLFAFNERYPEYVDESLLSISHVCAKFGIHLVISVNHMSDIKYKLRQNFDYTLPLLLAERGDYHEALGRMPDFMPAPKKGRGLCGKDSLEYQAALAVSGENEQVRSEKMREEFSAIAEKYAGGFCAQPIRSISKEEIYSQFLSKNKSNNNIPLGYDTEDISVISSPLATSYTFAISAVNRKAIDSMLKNMADAALAFKGKRHLISLKYDPLPGVDFDGIYRDSDDMVNLLTLLKTEFTQRSTLKKEFTGANSDFFDHVKNEYGLLFVFIDSINDFLNIVYDEHEEEYFPLVELFLKQGKGFGIYFVAGFELSAYGANMYRDAYKLYTDECVSIHLGGQLDKQKLLDIPFLSREDTKPRGLSDGIIEHDSRLIRIFIPPNRL